MSHLSCVTQPDFLPPEPRLGARPVGIISVLTLCAVSPRLAGFGAARCKWAQVAGCWHVNAAVMKANTVTD